MAYDLVIRNGLVVDGTGSPGFEADVAVEGENIAAIGKNLGPGKKEIDAKGQSGGELRCNQHCYRRLRRLLLARTTESRTPPGSGSIPSTRPGQIRRRQGLEVAVLR